MAFQKRGRKRKNIQNRGRFEHKIEGKRSVVSSSATKVITGRRGKVEHGAAERGRGRDCSIKGIFHPAKCKTEGGGAQYKDRGERFWENKR